MELTIATLAGMTEEEIALAVDAGVNSGSDLSTLCFADITAILPAASIVKRSKIRTHFQIHCTGSSSYKNNNNGRSCGVCQHPDRKTKNVFNR